MESLLSPSESHAFQSFLSSIDYNDQASTSPPEWGGSVYALHHQYRDDDILVDNVPQAQGTEALAKATKDLMSLDSNRWNSSSMSANHSHSQHDFNQQNQVYDSQGQYQHHHQQQLHQHQLQQPHRSSYSSSSRDSFPFLHTKNQQLRQQPSCQLWPNTQQQQQDSHNHHHPQHISIPHPSLPSHLLTPTASSSSSGGTPISPHAIFPYPPNNHHHLPVPPMSAPSSSSISKRTPLQHSLSSRGSTSSAASTSTTTPNPKRNRTSPPYARTPTGPAGNNGQPKQTLLSPSQKKANHIQSEQKRRANIRRGYEALCETVPALREAIREEEEAEVEARGNGEVNGKGKAAAAAKGKRGKKGKGGGEGEEKGEKDKVDGRAGPRSENVVLSKTIDYVQDLLAERSALLARLHRARASLPPGHPALVPLSPDPAWEREWKGGEGRLGDEEAEEEEEEEEKRASGEEDGSS